MTLGGIPLDKDVLIEIPTIAVHRDPDYYPELPGGKIGRAIEVKPQDSKKIGVWWDRQ